VGGISKIAFGSCGQQDKPQPIFDVVRMHKPDVFIFLGDNIYGDSYDMRVIKAKYDQLAAKPEYQSLVKEVPLLATWDDHDFGWNDSGRHYSKKDSTKQLFLDFFKVPSGDERSKRPGIYTSRIYEQDGKKLQVILLDTRTFRDDLRTYRGELHYQSRYFYPLDYYPHETSDSTLLGAAQWAWLENELRKPADLRIIASSTQFSIEYNGYEAWANFPHERNKMVDIIKRTGANGVLFISGDVHYAEISKFEAEDCYPLYDVTSSGITSTWYFATPNSNRIEGPVMDNHFGMISINWKETDPSICMEIFDIRNNQRVEHTITLSELRFKK
jgi:alkaline phosphatase D